MKPNANVVGILHYRQLCQAALDDYEGFWADLARALIIWYQPFTEILNETDAPFYRWFEDGTLNVSVNCQDKHLETIPNKTALIFEADNGETQSVTYRALYEQVCQFTNGLKALNLNVGGSGSHLPANWH